MKCKCCPSHLHATHILWLHHTSPLMHAKKKKEVIFPVSGSAWEVTAGISLQRSDSAVQWRGWYWVFSGITIKISQASMCVLSCNCVCYCVCVCLCVCLHVCVCLCVCVCVCVRSLQAAWRLWFSYRCPMIALPLLFVWWMLPSAPDSHAAPLLLLSSSSSTPVRGYISSQNPFDTILYK